MTEEIKQEQAEQSEETTTDEVVEETTDAAETEEEKDEATAESTQEEVAAEERKETLTHVYSGEVEGEIYSFDDLQGPSDEYTNDEYDEMVGMYENTLNEIEEKEIVHGRIVSIDDKYVVVDIGFKSEGIIPVNEFSNSALEEMEPGMNVEVFLDRVEDKDGQLILSRRKADILQAWEKIESSHENGDIIEGYIKRRIKGGMVVDVFGIDAFLPGSQIDVRPVRDFDAYVGKTMEFQVVKLNMAAENVVVSHRALIESDL
ncbi:MAG: S1 RNA-binding domain-containing protein, partial [Balneolaceae bacterium]